MTFCDTIWHVNVWYELKITKSYYFLSLKALPSPSNTFIIFILSSHYSYKWYKTISYYLIISLLLYITLQWVLFFTQIMIRAIVPDVPRFVTIQRKRTEYIRSKVVDKVADEADPEVIRSASLVKIKALGDIHQSAPGI